MQRAQGGLATLIVQSTEKGQSESCESVKRCKLLKETTGPFVLAEGPETKSLMPALRWYFVGTHRRRGRWRSGAVGLFSLIGCKPKKKGGIWNVDVMCECFVSKADSDVDNVLLKGDVMARGDLV